MTPSDHRPTIQTMQTTDSRTPTDTNSTPLPLLAVRGGIGGVLMGLANLVPGISGGTMLLAAGVYPRFINAIGEVTTFKFRKASMVLLGSVVLTALLAIVLLAGPVKDLVVHHRWVMYSLFIGLTLGGVPVVWRLIGGRRQHTLSVWIAAGVGLIAMGLLAYVQMQGDGGVERSGWVLMFLAGVAGASAMILPGVSGGYLLLVLGVYVPILSGIAVAKDAAKAGDLAGLSDPVLNVVLPVGLGVVVGVVVVSNLLKWLLARYEKPTLGVLLGLLLGAVVGLWPFQQGVAPQPGANLKGQTVVLGDAGELIFKQSGKPVEPDDYPTAVFAPSSGQITGAVGLIAGGFLVTMLVDLIGSGKRPTPPTEPDDTRS